MAFRDSRRLRQWLVMAMILVAAAGLRLWDLGAASIWHDEAWSIRAIHDPVHTPDDNTPPVYYAMMHVLWLGAGDSALALRYGSLLLDLLTIALTMRLARRWARWDAAVLAGVMLGASPLLWAYAREVRAYVVVPLLALVLLAMVDRLLAARTRFPWRVVGATVLVELVLLYTHNLSVPVVAWLNIVVVAGWALARAWRFLTLWLVGQAITLVLYLPWLMGQSPSGTSLNTPPELNFGQMWDIWQGYFAPVPAQIGEETALVIASALFAVAAVASLIFLLLRRPDRPARLVISQVVLLPVLSTAELLAAQIDFHPRYYVLAVPATLLMVVLAVDRVPSGRLREWAVPVGVALACGTSAASIPALLHEPSYQHDDFRAIADYYAQLSPDALILIPYGWEPALDVYYADRVGIKSETVGIDLHSDASTAIQTINAAVADRTLPVRVELLTWYQLPADVRGMYPCLLASVGQELDESLTVQGLSTQAYRIDRPLGVAQQDVGKIDFGILSLTDAAASGASSVCIETAWALQQPTSTDWRVSARLVTTDPAGWVLAQHDGDIRADDQAPTSELDPGATGAAYSLLSLPPGSPPGEYEVDVHVYSDERPNGLDRLVNGVPAGTALPLATMALQGATTTRALDDGATPLEIAWPDGITLVGYAGVGDTLNPGQQLRITLYWEGTDACCVGSDPWQNGEVVLRGADWEIAQSVRVYDGFSQDWHAFNVPAEASEWAELLIRDGEGRVDVLARVAVEATDRLFTAPALGRPLGANFEGVGILEGFTLESTELAAGQPFDLQLVWQATGTPSTSLRVFTHLLDVDNRVVAQHDGVPVGEMRSTTSWLPGEYLIDTHRLTFEFPGYVGAARLEVGLYDPETGERVKLRGGADHIILPVDVVVQ